VNTIISEDKFRMERAEIFGNRTADFWSQENAISRAKDEILLALSDLAQAKSLCVELGDYISRFKEKTVLILGDYNQPGKGRLISIRQTLNALGYNPVLLDEIPDDLHYNLQQKAVAIGSVSRFVIMTIPQNPVTW
jgi:hypothetical protein